MRVWLLPSLNRAMPWPISWLQAVLDLIFSKALDQAFFNHLYAQICFRMSSLNVENVQFKKLLLEKCTFGLLAWAFVGHCLPP